MNIVIHMGHGFPKGNACANRMRVFYEVLKKHEHNVVVLAPEDTGVADGINDKDVLICKAYKMKKKTAKSRLINNLSFAYSSIKRAREIEDVDVVITTSPPLLISLSGWWIAKVKRSKLVFDVRDIWPDVALEMESFSEKSIYCKIFRFIAKFMYKHSDLILTVSSGKVKKLQQCVKDKSKVILCENGLDEQFLQHTVDDSVIKRYDMENHFNCVYVGNIGLAQGLIHLLELAEQLISDNRVQFMLFGEGAEREQLEQVKAEKHLDNVHFIGNVYENEVFNVLRKAQLAYIPLVNAKLKDSIPTKTYEALGVGCPVLMVANGDATELVRESRLGRIVNPEEIADLSNVFRDILDRYESIISHKEEAIQLTKKKHSRQKIVTELNDKLLELIQKDDSLEKSKKILVMR